MQKQKWLYRLLLLSGYLTLLVGAVHNAASLFIFNDIPVTGDYMYMFLGTGTALIVFGLIIIYSSYRLRKGEASYRVVLSASTLFVILAAFAVYIFMPGIHNPFAWLLQATAILLLVVVSLLKPAAS